ncbi:GlxA family transcriptional regulator [Mycetocola saprophilus]|uniref:GlxA family transcriptional regulator n=1 Tax=Mycetocola saprophilus TaxID=76636 RepID=UPI0004C048D3|nr:DJ-1/PfpI family protein [Mycetocola saprophilus]
MPSHSIAFLLFPGVKQLDIVGPAEVFAEANRLGARYELLYVSADGAPVSTSIGAPFPATTRARDLTRADTLIIPGGDALPTAAIPPDILAATARLVDISARVASVCTGAFLLATTGALSGRRATTHWAHAGLLARLYPSITVTPDSIFVRDGRFHTSAGVSSGIDLALSLIETDHGPELAREVARQLVVYLRRPGGQSQFSTLNEVSRGSHDAVRRVIETIIETPAAAHTITDLAGAAGLSTRHLSRLFQAELGMTPARFIEGVRLDTAKALLLRGESVSVTSRRAGFQSAETMRRLFVTRLGMPPSVFQQRFRTSDRAD